MSNNPLHVGRGTLHESDSDDNHWMVRGVQNGVIKFTLHVFPTHGNGRRDAKGWIVKNGKPLDINNFLFFGIL